MPPKPSRKGTPARSAGLPARRAGGAQGAGGAGGRPRGAGAIDRAGTTAPRAGGARRELGGEQIEGRQAVRALLAARRRRVKDVWVADEVESAPILAEIRDLAEEARVPIRVVP